MIVCTDGRGFAQSSISARLCRDSGARLRKDQSVANIVQGGLDSRNLLRCRRFVGETNRRNGKLLILLALRAWLTVLDDFRNWLVNNAAVAKGHATTSGVCGTISELA